MAVLNPHQYFPVPTLAPNPCSEPAIDTVLHANDPISTDCAVADSRGAAVGDAGTTATETVERVPAHGTVDQCQCLIHLGVYKAGLGNSSDSSLEITNMV